MFPRDDILLVVLIANQVKVVLDTPALDHASAPVVARVPVKCHPWRPCTEIRQWADIPVRRISVVVPILPHHLPVPPNVIE